MTAYGKNSYMRNALLVSLCVHSAVLCFSAYISTERSKDDLITLDLVKVKTISRVHSDVYDHEPVDNPEKNASKARHKKKMSM